MAVTGSSAAQRLSWQHADEAMAMMAVQPVAAPRAAPALSFDPTSGKRGGKLIWQGYGDPGAGLSCQDPQRRRPPDGRPDARRPVRVHISGIQGNSGMDFGVQPNLAQALPEVSPDKLTFTIKLRPTPSSTTARRYDVRRRKVLLRPLCLRLRLGLQERLAVARKHAGARRLDHFVSRPSTPTRTANMSLSQRYTYVILAKEHEESAEPKRSSWAAARTPSCQYDPPR